MNSNFSLKISILHLLCLLVVLFLNVCVCQYPQMSNTNLNINRGAIYFDSTMFIQDGSAQSVSQTKAFDTPFTSIPQVLISLEKIDMTIREFQYEDFNGQISEVTKTSFKVTVSKKSNGANIYYISFKYIAFESSTLAYAVQGQFDFQLNLDTTQSSIDKIISISKIKLPYKRALASTETRKITAFFTGYEKQNLSTGLDTETNFQLYSKLDTATNDYYIIAESRDPKQSTSLASTYQNKMKTFYYNYIEFYEPSNKYYILNQFPNTEYLQKVPANHLGNNGSNTTITVTNIIDIESQKTLFYGVRGVGFSLNNQTFIGRISVWSPTFTPGTTQASSIFTYNYETWDSTEVTSVASELIALERLDCSMLNMLFDDIQRRCTASCPDHYYGVQDITGRFFCRSCHANCLTCSGPTSTECLSCDSQFLLEKQCYPTQIDQTGCESSTKVCERCTNQDCLLCNYSNLNQCTSCPSGFIVKDGKCVCENPIQFFSESEQKCVNKEEPISENIKVNVQISLEIAEHAIFALNLLFIFTQAVSQRGSVFLSSVFTNQKVYYIMLLDSNLPTYLNSFTSSLTNQGVLKKFSYLNWFSPINPSFNAGSKFQSEGITNDFLVNAGGALTLLLFTTGFFLLFFILIKSSQRNRIISIYEKFLGAFFTESLEVALIVLQFSITLAFVQIQSLEGFDLIFTILLISTSQIFILLFISICAIQLNQIKPNTIIDSNFIINNNNSSIHNSNNINNHINDNINNNDNNNINNNYDNNIKANNNDSSNINNKKNDNNINSNNNANNNNNPESNIHQDKEVEVKQIILDKILNGCMKEFKWSRLYMMIFIMIECVLFPILIVVARSNYYVQIFGLISIQGFELIFTAIVRPYYLKRENVISILVQCNMLINYGLIAAITFSLENSSERASNEYTTLTNVLSFSYLGIAMFAMLTPAQVQIYLVGLEILAYIRNRKKPITEAQASCKKQSTELMDYSEFYSNKFISNISQSHLIEEKHLNSNVKHFQYLQYKHNQTSFLFKKFYLSEILR